VLNKLKLVWNESGLQATLETQILTGFLWISAEIPLDPRPLKELYMMRWTLRVMWLSIGDDMSHHW